jgi:ribosomal protein L27
MSIGSILLGLSLLIIVVLILAQPFWAQPEREPRRRSRKQQLLLQKEAVLEEIRALDFEYDTRKIPEEDYQAQRTELLAIATDTLKALDELGTEAPADDTAAQIEAAIKRVRTQKQTPAQAVGTGSSTAVPAKANGATKFCTECGAKVKANDKFCAACGNKIAIPA